MAKALRKHFVRRAMAVALVAGLLGGMPESAVSAQHSRDFRSTQPLARPAAPSDYWRPRQDEIRAQLRHETSLETVRLVFLGDSITDFWTTAGSAVWNESFGGTDPVNRGLNLGLAGDRTEHVLYRIRPSSEGGLGELDRADLDPEVVVLLVGINNTWNAEEPAAQSVFQGIRAVVEEVHKRKPNALIVLQSLLPTNEPRRNSAIVAPVNSALAEFAAGSQQANHVRYLDLYTAFTVVGGQQNPALFVDGLHPNENGYRVWRDRLVPFLAAIREN